MAAATDDHTDLQTLTITEVAGLLQVSTKTIRNRVERGEFPKPRMFGRFPRWPVEVVRDWMNSSPES